MMHFAFIGFLVVPYHVHYILHHEELNASLSSDYTLLIPGTTSTLVEKFFLIIESHSNDSIMTSLRFLKLTSPLSILDSATFVLFFRLSLTTYEGSQLVDYKKFANPCRLFYWIFHLRNKSSRQSLDWWDIWWWNVLSTSLFFNPWKEESHLSVHAWIVGCSAAWESRAQDSLKAVVTVQGSSLVERAHASSSSHNSST